MDAPSSRGGGKAGGGGAPRGGGGGGGSKGKSKAKTPRQGSVDSMGGDATAMTTATTTPTKAKKAKGKGRPPGSGSGGAKGGKKGRKRSETRESSLAGRGSAVPLEQEDARGGPSYGDGNETRYGNEEEEDDEEYDEAGAGGEEGAEDEAEGDDEGLLEEDEWIRQEAVQKARQANIGPLVDAMTEDQRERFFAYRSQKLEKRHVRRLVNHLTNQSVTDSVATLAAGAAKIFVGDIVERARAVQQEKGQAGPLRPEHLLEAHRLYREEREKPGRYPPGAPNASAGVAGSGKRRRMF